MANTRKHANATMRNIYFDGDLLKAIKEKDPFFNLSAEVNAMLKEKVELQKNEQALKLDLNPLNLIRADPEKIKDSRQSTLFETFASRDRRDEINAFIKSVDQEAALKKIELNCRAMLGVASTRRRNLSKVVYHKL